MRTKLLLASILAWFIAHPAMGDSTSMIQATDLRELARVAERENLVLVIEFSSEYCGYCRKLEDLFLLPMQRNDEYDSKVLIRSVSLDAHETVIDFRGRLVDTTEFASRYDVMFTPTLLFLDARGVEQSERLVGIWSEDFYGGFIDKRIDGALVKLKLE